MIVVQRTENRIRVLRNGPGTEEHGQGPEQSPIPDEHDQGPEQSPGPDEQGRGPEQSPGYEEQGWGPDSGPSACVGPDQIMSHMNPRTAALICQKLLQHVNLQ